MPTAPHDYDTATVIAQIIQSEMVLDEDHCNIYNQKYRIPPDEGLFVVVSIIGSHPFGVVSRWVNQPNSNELVEEQGLNVVEMLQIDIFSKDPSARRRAHEVIFALNSNRAQQACDLYQFSIGRLPTSFNDISFLEASARLNRYALAFNVTRGYSKTAPIPFFDQFSIPPELHVNQ